MTAILIKNATIVNENRIFPSDLLIKNSRIEKIASEISAEPGIQIINAEGLTLIPGIIDDQVHFREPGGTAKATIASESRAAVAGGTTSFMDMPNTSPQTTTIEEWKKKQILAAGCSPANYGFFLGATNTNIDEIRKLDPKICPGLKVFMGSSTGNMLVDNMNSLDLIFRESPALIATHCENSAMIAENEVKAREKYGENVPVSCHPEIRSRAACLESTKLAVELAQRHKADLHIFHVSTKEEVQLLKDINRGVAFPRRRITAEACMPHLMFASEDYETLGTRIKCNPAVKTREDRSELIGAVRDGIIDIIATDHAPHLMEEKRNSYFKAPSGIPMCQHTLYGLLELRRQGELTLERIVEATSHHVASRYHITDRGYIREGYFADLTLVDLDGSFTVSADSLLYKCRWSPFEGRTFGSRVVYTLVNGAVAYAEGVVCARNPGMAMTYCR
ncbi:MAG: dihydroorotase [Succinivibrionaceae bacterium]|nr:dihydroorotase [Succinivibrionaceae bacterium]